MKMSADSSEKMMAAYQLLGQGAISVSSLAHVFTLLKGLHPELDKKLFVYQKAFDTLQKLQSGDAFCRTLA